MTNDLNLPFEPSDPFEVQEPLIFSGGVVVCAMYLTLGDPGVPAGQVKHPAVMFRFAKHDGTGFHPPIVLACDRVNDLRALPALVEEAVKHAIEQTS